MITYGKWDYSNQAFCIFHRLFQYLGIWYHVWGKVDFSKPGSKCGRAEYTDIGEFIYPVLY
jgi:hypothetical protein